MSTSLLNIWLQAHTHKGKHAGIYAIMYTLDKLTKAHK